MNAERLMQATKRLRRGLALGLLVTYAVEPSATVSASRVNSEGRCRTDWRA